MTDIERQILTNQYFIMRFLIDPNDDHARFALEYECIEDTLDLLEKDAKENPLQPL